MKLLSFLILFCSFHSYALELGFNQAWLKNKYAHQWINYDEVEAKRIIDLAADANAKILRMWLFEGTNPKGIIWKNGIPISIDQKYLKNLEHFIQYSEKRNLKLNFTLFDGNIINQSSFQKYKDRWWNLLNNKYKTADKFLHNILSPLLGVLNKYPNVVTQIDLANEINALNGIYYIFPYMFQNEWKGLNKFVCKWSKNIKSKLHYNVQLTASFGWGNASSQILSDKLKSKCIDFYEIHLYNNEGNIPSCSELKKFSQNKKKPIQLGEFGQKSKAYNDELQVKNLKSFVQNAKQCGISKALAWRLSDIRSGVNEEARFSFEAFGKPREAYYIFSELAKYQD